MANSGLNFSNLEIFSAKHLPRQIFPKLTVEILSKVTFSTKLPKFSTLNRKYAMQKPQIPKFLFELAILPHRLEERKSTEKFRVSPRTAARGPSRAIAQILHGRRGAGVAVRVRNVQFCAFLCNFAQNAIRHFCQITKFCHLLTKFVKIGRFCQICQFWSVWSKFDRFWSGGPKPNL